MVKGEELNIKHFWSFHNYPGDIYGTLKKAEGTVRKINRFSRIIKSLVF